MPNLNKSSLNCICPVFTNNLSRSNQLFFYITNIHTYMCVCVYTAMHRKGSRSLTPLSNIGRTSRKGQGSLMSIVTIPFHCLDGNQSSDGNQLVRNKHPTLPSPRDTTVESRGHSLPRRQSECFLAVNSSPLLQASC